MITRHVITRSTLAGAMLYLAGCASVEPTPVISEIRDVEVVQECPESTLTSVSNIDSNNDLQRMATLDAANLIPVVGQIKVDYLYENTNADHLQPTFFIVKNTKDKNTIPRLLPITSGESFVMMLTPGDYFIIVSNNSKYAERSNTALKSFHFQVYKYFQVIYIGDLIISVNEQSELISTSITDNSASLIQSTLPSLQKRLIVSVMTESDIVPSLNPENGNQQVMLIEPDLLENTLVDLQNLMAQNKFKKYRCGPDGTIMAGELSIPLGEIQEEDAEKPLNAVDVVKGTVGGAAVLAVCVLLSPICFMLYGY